jgi:ubiquinone/menaquinone biosynthesis C-methylase UbiE
MIDALQCVSCGEARMTAPADREAIVCGACGRSYPRREGVLHLSHGADALVEAERHGSVATEHDASMGGIGEAFDDLAHATGPLRDALLALPFGNGSRYYDEPGYFANVRRSGRGFEFVVSHLGLRPGARLLDVGADVTWSTAWFARRGAIATAIDINHHLPVGRLFQEAFGVTYDLVNVDAHAPAFRDHTFDIVSAFHTLHHSGRIDELARNLARVLVPGGRLGLCEPFCTTEAQRQAFGQDLVAIGVNEHVYTLDEWHAAFSAAGLRPRAILLTESFNAIYEKPAGRQALSDTKTGPDAKPLFADYYDGQLDLPHGPQLVARAGEALDIPVRLMNRGIGTWCSESEIPVLLSYHLHREEADGRRTLVAFDNPRTPLPADVAPESRTTVRLPFFAPATAGRYLLDLDLVQERVTWFADRGFRTATLRLDVHD